MHPFFEPLDSRETMLLLTTLMAGSEEAAVFRHLPTEQRARVQQKADALLALPSEKRVPFMVQQLKQLIAFRGLRGVEKVDPSWILHGLRGESARVVACVLITLPPPTVRSVLKRLPPGIRKKLPPKNEIKAVPQELVEAVRQIFESRFHEMPEPSPKGFAYRDVVQLEKTDLFRLMRDLGLIELGQAFVAVGKMALAELCRRLPRDKAEELILAVRSASLIDVPDIKNAQRFLSRVVVNFTDSEEFFQKAGLWRMAKASLIEDDAFREGFRQRLPRDAGQLFFTYMEKAGEIEELSPEMLQRLQDSVLMRIRELSKQGAIEPRWRDMQMLFHSPVTNDAA
ncbi:MAG: hypothetical protein ACAI38_10470 [Myxococcota bacterium]|nr:hypothetical protein [Myxococcota bacterium]